MELSQIPTCAVLECLVVFFQVFGVAALCAAKLFPRSRVAHHARYAYVLALVGLGIVGASCGRHDSQFALFAGVTMTVLLIGMISGGGGLDLTAPTGRARTANQGYAA